ncbi:MAG: hypothetical protein M3070_07300 [Actinomycetota bacterium]|nr:hypothetical protein [Actinomycetota bacterium]
MIVIVAALASADLCDEGAVLLEGDEALLLDGDGALLLDDDEAVLLDDDPPPAGDVAAGVELELHAASVPASSSAEPMTDERCI